MNAEIDIILSIGEFEGAFDGVIVAAKALGAGAQGRRAGGVGKKLSEGPA